MVPGSNQDCYVVFKGRHPGIYPTCEVAEPEVTEFSHNLHRRYPTYEAGWYEAGWKAWFEFSGGQVNGGSLSGGELQLVSVAEDVPISGYAPLPTETGFHVRDDSYYRRVFEPTWGPFTKYENFWKQVGVKTQHSVATQSPVEGTTSQGGRCILGRPRVTV
ncbi:uncharacterized protein LOC107648290 isoform X2 [Arachis ipaensis]|uniref:uncharacterized protein LOC107648290 isoform X2 n=1 Tax=Arachis ipaensis TaxID=130454 RepID=UPI0007AEFEA0|nr:uncharacterized protein LOC107648290 isoform X2 [Arachis ipaensis]XP_025658058.1 uncharacterized protein LOC112754587 isoform X2 [Arachis hypogaea]QHN86472.1 uncharacterized protein DS421_16g546580 [Arachis hypogaea]